MHDGGFHARPASAPARVPRKRCPPLCRWRRRSAPPTGNAPRQTTRVHRSRLPKGRPSQRRGSSSGLAEVNHCGAMAINRAAIITAPRQPQAACRRTRRHCGRANRDGMSRPKLISHLRSVNGVGVQSRHDQSTSRLDQDETEGGDHHHRLVRRYLGLTACWVRWPRPRPKTVSVISAPAISSPSSSRQGSPAPAAGHSHHMAPE